VERRGSQTARPRFTNNDVAVLRLCERKGWTLADWYTLDEREQLEWLAYDNWRQQVISRMLKSVQKKDGTVVDAAAYVRLWLETI